MKRKGCPDSSNAKRILPSSMSYTQKIGLCEAIVRLNSNQIENVTDIISKQEPELLEISENEWCFDVNVLKVSTLWEIKNYIESLSKNLKDKSEKQLDRKNLQQDTEHENEVQKKITEIVAMKKEEHNKNDSKGKKEKFTISIEVHDIREGTTCKTCNKCFSDRSNLIKHLRIHTGEMPYQCSICGKLFRHSTSLNSHSNTHKLENPYRCTHEGCTKRFSNQPNLKRHMRIHTGEKPFICFYCGKEFTQSSNCKQHEKWHLKNGDKPVV